MRIAVGALARAHRLDAETPASELLAALWEIVEALDRRIRRSNGRVNGR